MRCKIFILIALTALTLGSVVLPHATHAANVADAASTAAPHPLADAIAKQMATAPETLNPDAVPGYLGIPGGPKINMLLAFGWALWVGWIFSTVGAFGGVMAGVGHMTVHDLGNYAKSFGKTPLNKAVTDSVRASNQMLALLSALLSTFSYYRLKRIVLPLGVALGLGSIIGAHCRRGLRRASSTSRPIRATSDSLCSCWAATSSGKPRPQDKSPRSRPRKLPRPLRLP